jgi:magnesium-transporting ATPase (P-type)
VAGSVLFTTLPGAVDAAFFAHGALWAVAVVCAALCVVAAVVSLPFRGIMHWAKIGCGKFYAVICGIFTGLPVTYAFWQMSSSHFAGSAAGRAYVVFGGVLMLIGPIIAMYKYVK